MSHFLLFSMDYLGDNRKKSIANLYVNHLYNDNRLIVPSEILLVGTGFHTAKHFLAEKDFFVSIDPVIMRNILSVLRV